MAAEDWINQNGPVLASLYNEAKKLMFYPTLKESGIRCRTVIL